MEEKLPKSTFLTSEKSLLNLNFWGASYSLWYSFNRPILVIGFHTDAKHTFSLMHFCLLIFPEIPEPFFNIIMDKWSSSNTEESQHFILLLNLGKKPTLLEKVNVLEKKREKMDCIQIYSIFPGLGPLPFKLFDYFVIYWFVIYRMNVRLLWI